jgi:hypothetical protein
VAIERERVRWQKAIHSIKADNETLKCQLQAWARDEEQSTREIAALKRQYDAAKAEARELARALLDSWNGEAYEPPGPDAGVALARRILACTADNLWYVRKELADLARTGDEPRPEEKNVYVLARRILADELAPKYQLVIGKDADTNLRERMELEYRNAVLEEAAKEFAGMALAAMAGKDTELSAQDAAFVASHLRAAKRGGK